MSAAVRLRRLPRDDVAWPASTERWPDVSAIVERVRTEGDRAVAEIARRLGDPPPREVGLEEQRAAFDATDPELRAALLGATQRIEQFARAQRAAISDIEVEACGLRLGHRVVPIRNVGVYVPGGRHALPSSLLMCTIPARVAGVSTITACSPHAARETLAAAYIAKVDRFYEVGGAQAIAALAFGTDLIPRVDLIAGPGNAYVTAAKREVYGVCGLDALAGPSELIVIASRDADPGLVAADLLAQAEHDVAARAMLLTDDEAFAEDVAAEIDDQLPSLATHVVARAALSANGCAAILPLESAIEAANRLAPEHLELLGARAERLAPRAETYGALFVGQRTGAVFGDYGTGPNHVLPTNGTARFTSGLSVFTFLTIRTYQRSKKPTDEALLAQTAFLAATEGLDGHRRSAAYRARARRGRR